MLVHVNVHVPKNFFLFVHKVKVIVVVPLKLVCQITFASTKMCKLTINGLLLFGLVDKYHNAYLYDER